MNPSFHPPSRQNHPPQVAFPVPRYSNPLGKRQLPSDFSPDSTAVICGRGKACTNSPGNKRLKAIVKDHISDYSSARNKAEKTIVVNAIMEELQGKNKEKGLFVRQHERTWWEVDDAVAREKVGCMIRDGLHTQYRSSSRSKFLKKRGAQLARRSENESRSPSDSSDKDAFKPNPVVLPGGTSSENWKHIYPGLFSLSSRVSKSTAETPLNTPISSYLPRSPRPSNFMSMQTNMFNHDLNNQSLAPLSGRIEIGGPDDVRARRSRDEDAEWLATEKRNWVVSQDLKKRQANVGTRTRSVNSPDESGSSPDSTAWIRKSRGHVYLQHASHIIADDELDSSLPDDLSGIFDD